VTPFHLIVIGLTAIIGIVCVASSLTGYFKTKMSIIERLAFLIGGILLVTTNLASNLVGIALLAGVYIIQRSKDKRNINDKNSLVV
jgi:TRAP-type uncharacterized transport system fused permease subunit